MQIYLKKFKGDLMRFLILLVLCIISVVFVSSSYATVILTNDINIFENSGTTNVVSDFEEFSKTGFDFPNDPFLQGGISYNNTDNLIINNATGYITNGTNMLVNNLWNPVESTFYEEYSLFGFFAGWSSSDDNGTVMTIGTNLDTYIFNVDFDIASSADFYGFIADENEYFTSFNIYSNNFYALNAIDNVTVGTTSSAPVPEPSTMLMFGSGIIGLAGISRRKKITKA